MDSLTRVAEPSLQEGDGFRLGALVRSDSLPQLLSFARSIPGLATLLKDIVQIGVVLDAQIVQQELRWRVRRRKKPDVRTGLFLDSEIEEHLAGTSGTIAATHTI